MNVRVSSHKRGLRTLLERLQLSYKNLTVKSESTASNFILQHYINTVNLSVPVLNQFKMS